MWCPYCYHASLARVCSHCGGMHEALSARIKRRYGSKKLLIRPAVSAAVLALVLGVMSTSWVGLVMGALLGALLGMAFQSLIRVKRYR